MWTADEIAFAIFLATCAYVFLMLIYVILVSLTLLYIHKQLEQQKKENRLQEALAISKELEAPELFNQRRYIYEHFPENIEGIESSKLKAHIQKAGLALVAFKRIGYLIEKGHIDKEPILENYWPSIWRCWKKSKNLIVWMRSQRNEPKYLEKFDYLFNLSDSYRIQNGYEEPKIYGISSIIT